VGKVKVRLRGRLRVRGMIRKIYAIIAKGV